MITWKPNTCDCSFTLNNGSLVGCSKGTMFDHHLMSDQDAYDAAVLLSASQPPSFAPIKPMYMRLALLEFNMLASIEEALAVPENKAMQIAFEYALQFERNDPLINSFAQSFGLTTQQVDDLFSYAQEIQV